MFFRIFNLFIPKAYALTTGIAIGGQTTFSGYCGYIKAFFNYSIGIGFGLAFLMIVYAGIKYAISQGNQSALSEAKEIILGALLGFILLLLVNFILKFLGVSNCNLSA